MIRRALLAAALGAAACSTNPISSATGEFNSPTGIGSVSAGDRDLVFIANSGRDSLRALQVCNHALQVDGGRAPDDTCSTDEDLQFVPAPIRVFAATVETGNRPVRVAGARVTRTDGAKGGAGLAVGKDSTVAIIDAYSLAQAPRDGGTPTPVQHLDLQANGGPPDAGTLAVDVVTANPMNDNLVEDAVPAQGKVTAYVATVQPPQLVELTVGLDANNLPAVTEVARCKLDPASVPSKIAVAPGSDADVWVADLGGPGGIVHVAKTAIEGAGGGLCGGNRIAVNDGVNDRRVRHVTASPAWFEPTPDEAAPDIVHPAGQFLLAVLEPLTCSGTSPECAITRPGIDADPGGVLFVRTSDNTVVPIPSADISSDTAAEKMQPLSLPAGGLLQEGAFLRAVKPHGGPAEPPGSPALVPPDLTPCTKAPCTPVYIGVPSGSTTHTFPLVAAVSATDGATYLIDVVNRRFVNSSFFDLVAVPSALDPVVDVPPSLSPAQATNAPVFTGPKDLNSGVTHTSRWRAIWHSAVPGLNTRAGTITPAPANDGTLLFSTPPANLNLWTQDPAIQLVPGDLVSFVSYTLSDTSAGCQDLVSRASLSPRFELRILSIAADSMVLSAPDPSLNFGAAACPAFGVVAEVRVGEPRPWLVLQNDTARGRAAADGSFTSHERRFDYPRDYTTLPAPNKANDVGLSFQITGAPATAGAGFSFSVTAGGSIISFRDSVLTTGYASGVYAYSSLRRQSLVYSSVTGTNELIQADPALLFSNVLGVIVFR